MLTTKRLARMSLEERKTAIFLERVKCFNDYKYLIETYFTVDAGGSRKPFILFPHQADALVKYIKFQNNITMKTRQMGFTTFTSAFIACEIINKNNFKTLIISKEMNSAKDFLKNIKDILDNARNLTKISKEPESKSWLIPEYAEGYNNKESFLLANGSTVKAQGNTEDAGRGMSGLNLAVVDEVAVIDRKTPGKMKEIFSALSPALSTVKGKTIMISTPRGAFGWYYDTYTNARERGFNVINAHWTAHPLFNMGQYQWVLDPKKPGGGELKFYNDKWPEELLDRDSGISRKIPKDKYQFILDGNVRSPWYDTESMKLGPIKTLCELDCSFVGTGGEVFEAVILRNMQLFSDTQKFEIPYAKGVMTKYREYEKPEEHGIYVLAADVATGDGSDFSTIVVLNLRTLKICATFKAQLLPNAFARVVMEIGRKYNKAIAVVENAGGGGTTLQELKVMGYSHIYYSTLNKKDESLGVKKRKIGLWVSDEVRTKGGDKLEEFIRTQKLQINCTEIVSEFYNWIWDKDGKRRHAPGKHDDLIMALQHAVYYYFYVYNRNLRNRTNFLNVFDQESISVWGQEDPVKSGRGLNILAGEKDKYSPFGNKKINGADMIDQKRNFFQTVMKQNGRKTVAFI